MTLIRAEISRSALAHNIKLIGRYAEDSPIWAVLKANAYGHGIHLVLPEIISRVHGIACARLKEAKSIRSHLIDLGRPDFPVLILGGVYDPQDFFYVDLPKIQSGQ